MIYCPLCATKLVEKEIDGRMRKACPAEGCGFVFWDNPVPVVAAIVEHEDAVILVRQPRWPEGFHGLVTGFLERDETPEQGVLREVKEELDLDGRVASLVGVYEFIRRNQVLIAYHVIAEGVVTLNDELEAWKSVPPDKLEPWGSGTGRAVRDWLDLRHRASPSPAIR
ncbi:NUDIX hydrolase, partial [bacterium]|nr:NUDIX hydrolase [candidate division CSSED10-310 bacterium]